MASEARHTPQIHGVSPGVCDGTWTLEGVEPVNSLILFGHFLQDDWQIGKQGYFNGDEHDEINIVEIKCD
jgi:hypothetical protein